MRHPRRRLASLVPLGVLIACLAGASPAPAATPFTAGQGGPPKLAVGADGRGHVAWGIPARAGQPARVGYCRIPAGASACDVTLTLDYPASGDVPQADPVDVAIAVPSATKIVITGSCVSCGGETGTDRIHAFVSTDGGTSFAAPAFLGVTPTTAGLQDGGLWLDGPGLFVTPGEGTRILIAGSGAATTPTIDAVGAGHVYDTSIAAVPGSTKLVHAADDLGQIQFAVFTGLLTAAELGDPAKWLTGRTLTAPESDSVEAVVTSGASGLWLAYHRNFPGQTRVLLRRFDPATDGFGAATAIPIDPVADISVDGPDVSADAGGRLHAVWRSPADSGHLRYTRSGTDGTGFAAAGDIAAGENYLDLEVAAGGDGAGWAAWHTGGDTPIRVVLLDTAQPVFQTPQTTTSTSVPGATIGFSVPKACVQPGSSFKVTLKWKRKKRKGNLFVKVTRADFYIGSKVVRSDRRAPFVQTLTVTASARRGSTITLRARAFIKVKHGKAPKKSIRSTIKVCA